MVFLTIAYRQSRDKYNGIFLDLEQGRLKSINQVLACFDITKVSDISMVIFYYARIFKIIKIQREMWETVLKTIISKFGFRGSLIGCLGKKIQFKKNQHGEIYSMSIFGEGKNIQFLVQSFTPGQGQRKSR